MDGALEVSVSHPFSLGVAYLVKGRGATWEEALDRAGIIHTWPP